MAQAVEKVPGEAMVVQGSRMRCGWAIQSSFFELAAGLGEVHASSCQ